MAQTFINPFEKYSEQKLIAAGIIAACIGSLLAFSFNGRFDGVFDFHVAGNIALRQPFIDNAVNIGSLFILLFIAAKAVNKKTRPADIAATALVARMPLYLLPFMNANGFMSGIEAKLITAGRTPLTLSETETALLIVAALAGLFVVMWFVVLAFNGFKTASNAKKGKHIALFALALLLSEMLSKLFFYYI